MRQVRLQLPLIREEGGDNEDLLGLYEVSLVGDVDTEPRAKGVGPAEIPLHVSGPHEKLRPQEAGSQLLHQHREEPVLPEVGGPIVFLPVNPTLGVVREFLGLLLRDDEEAVGFSQDLFGLNLVELPEAGGIVIGHVNDLEPVGHVAAEAQNLVGSRGGEEQRVLPLRSLADAQPQLGHDPHLPFRVDEVLELRVFPLDGPYTFEIHHSDPVHLSVKGAEA